MPAIRSQSVEVLSDTQARLTLQTSTRGLIVVNVTRAGTGAGTTITLQTLLDGVQVSQQTLNNPTIAQVETAIQDAIFAITGAALQVRVHFFSVNPTVSLTVGCFDTGLLIPAQWWT